VIVIYFLDLLEKMTQGDGSLFNINSKEKKNKKKNIKLAIDSLLFSNSSETEESPIKITECSSVLDAVINNKQGGICTNCNALFKSQAFLVNHISKCLSNHV